MEPDEDPRIDGARRRWRAAGDRLWPVALCDGESYRLAAEVVGTLVAALRERAGSLTELVELETGPAAFLAGVDAAGPAGSGVAGAGAHAAARPDLLAAACAVRGDELAADRARRRRAGRIAGARADGSAWVELDRTPTRVVEMHVGSGAALVATADPYLGDEPFRVAEIAVDPVSGDPLPGPDDDGAAFASADAWQAERERRRHAIAGRLDTRDPAGSDR